jgi:hypothetical protein
MGINVDPVFSSQCEKWIVSNQKDMVLLNLVTKDSNIDNCQQYCVIAGSGFRADTTTCRSLCELAGFKKFSKALAIDQGLALPADICDNMFKSDASDEVDSVVAMVELSSTQATKERKLGIRGDLTVQGSLSASVITSPVGDVKVSGEMNVLNSMESTSATTSILKADGGISVKQGIISKKDQLLIKGKIDADSVSMVNLQASFLEIDGVKQWALHSLEDFEEVGVDGWSHAEVTECGGHRILGGHCVQSGKGELTKTFTDLPPHSQIRINAKYMFIDSWDGETGYLKADNNMVWAESYNHADGATQGINICGNETPEKKFGRTIDLTVPHTQNSITLTFGATTDEHPCDESFGIDSVMIFTR